MSMDELLSRQVPQSLEAEQSVLGSMLIDERCVPDVIALLQPDEFYLQQNRDIFETIYTMFNFSQHIDPVTVLDKMKERGVYDEAHSYDYISQLLQITPTAANVKQYCAIVHDKALMRNLGTAADEITAMVQDGAGTAQEMLEAAEKRSTAFAKKTPATAYSISERSLSTSMTGWRSLPSPEMKFRGFRPGFMIWIKRSTVSISRTFCSLRRDPAWAKRRWR